MGPAPEGPRYQDSDGRQKCGSRQGHDRDALTVDGDIVQAHGFEARGGAGPAHADVQRRTAVAREAQRGVGIKLSRAGVRFVQESGRGTAAVDEQGQGVVAGKDEAAVKGTVGLGRAFVRLGPKDLLEAAAVDLGGDEEAVFGSGLEVTQGGQVNGNAVN